MDMHEAASLSAERRRALMERAEQRWAEAKLTRAALDAGEAIALLQARYPQAQVVSLRATSRLSNVWIESIAELDGSPVIIGDNPEQALKHLGAALRGGVELRRLGNGAYALDLGA